MATIEIHIHEHVDLAAIKGKLDAILETLVTIKQGEAKMSAELDALQAAVTNEDTVIDSAITLLQGLSAQIATLKNDPVALQALADDVTAKSAALAAAVAANTPPAPTPAP